MSKKKTAADRLDELSYDTVQEMVNTIKDMEENLNNNWDSMTPVDRNKVLESIFNKKERLAAYEHAKPASSPGMSQMLPWAAALKALENKAPEKLSERVINAIAEDEPKGRKFGWQK
jgi:hypothetical protein